MTFEQFIEKYNCTEDEFNKLEAYLLALKLRGITPYIYPLWSFYNWKHQTKSKP